MANQNQQGLQRIFNAFFFSMAGLKKAWQHEEAFRQEVSLFIVTFPFALWLGETKVEKVLLIGTALLVIIVEILNSAIEAVVDRVSPEIHELSGRAKDMGSAAVFLSLTLMFVTWFFLLLF
ncbi:MAG: diacylglycerol kinase [Methylococcaceae bacterium]